MVNLVDIIEDVDSDFKSYTKAYAVFNRFYNAIQTYFSGRTPNFNVSEFDHPDKNFLDKVYATRIPLTNDRSQEVVMFLRFPKEGYDGPSGWYDVAHNHIHIVITRWMAGPEDKAEILSTIRYKKNVIIHEVTHAIDQHREDANDLESTSIDDGDDVYYNNATEYNAYFIQHAQPLIRAYKAVREYEKTGQEDYMDDAIDEGIHQYPDFATYLENHFYMEGWNTTDWFTKLNDKWRKKAIRRLARIYNSCVPIIKSYTRASA